MVCGVYSVHVVCVYVCICVGICLHCIQYISVSSQLVFRPFTSHNTIYSESLPTPSNQPAYCPPSTLSHRLQLPSKQTHNTNTQHKQQMSQTDLLSPTRDCDLLSPSFCTFSVSASSFFFCRCWWASSCSGVAGVFSTSVRLSEGWAFSISTTIRFVRTKMPFTSCSSSSELTFCRLDKVRGISVFPSWASLSEGSSPGTGSGV